MKVGKGRRTVAVFMCLTMLFSTLGATDPAGGGTPTGGLCEHHPEHTAECGYAAPTEASPCQHVHDGSCGGFALRYGLHRHGR